MMLSSWCWCWRVAVVLMWVAPAAAAAAATTGKIDAHQRATAAGDTIVVQQLESSLLSSFGMKQRPRLKKDVVVPPYMLELYHLQQTRQAEAVTTTTPRSGPKTLTSKDYNIARSFNHQESKADDHYPTHRMRLRFNLASLPSEEVLQSAELRLSYVRHSAAPDQGLEDPNIDTKLRGRRQRRWTSGAAPYLQRIKVYDVLRPATRFSEPTLRLLDTQIVDARQTGVRSLDVSEPVSRWLAKPRSNFGLLVEVLPFTETSTLDASHVRLRRSTEEDDKWPEQQPLLVIYANDGKAKVRSKRAAVNKHKKTRETCQRHHLHVDFRQVGWDDWIVAPSGYDAYFCKGECYFPLHDSLNATNHAVVQTLVNSRYPDRVPRACCVPTDLSPISMLYVDNDKVFVLKNHQDMVVEGCGCR